MTQIVCSLEHPIIFVFDFDYDDVEIPEYDETQVVSKNEYCLSVRTVSEIDGDVVIGLNENVSTERMIEVFKGTINVPNHKLAIVDSQNNKLLEADVSSERARICVLVDDEVFPGHIEIIAFSPTQ